MEGGESKAVRKIAGMSLPGGGGVCSREELFGNSLGQVLCF